MKSKQQRKQVDKILRDALYIEIDDVIFVTSSIKKLKIFLEENFYSPDFIKQLSSGDWREVDPELVVQKGTNLKYKLMDLVLIRNNEILTDQLYEKGEENGY